MLACKLNANELGAIPRNFASCRFVQTGHP
jgi:hypothetical protein